MEKGWTRYREGSIFFIISFDDFFFPLFSYGWFCPLGSIIFFPPPGDPGFPPGPCIMMDYIRPFLTLRFHPHPSFHKLVVVVVVVPQISGISFFCLLRFATVIRGTTGGAT
ncbi:hypothetical protein HOY80DRAFT_18972 [Tuber brumale]|nr:hypothetical protein HOY80DRAFT_18972 [Tuber brumale]